MKIVDRRFRRQARDRLGAAARPSRRRQRARCKLKRVKQVANVRNLGFQLEEDPQRLIFAESLNAVRELFLEKVRDILVFNGRPEIESFRYRRLALLVWLLDDSDIRSGAKKNAVCRLETALQVLVFLVLLVDGWRRLARAHIRACNAHRRQQKRFVS